MRLWVQGRPAMVVVFATVVTACSTTEHDEAESIRLLFTVVMGFG